MAKVFWVIFLESITSLQEKISARREVVQECYISGWKNEIFANFERLTRWSFFYLIVWGLSSHLRIFDSYEDVTITGEGLQILTYARWGWGFFSVPHLLRHGASVYNGLISLWTRDDSRTFCRAFSSGAVTTWF